ncbi:hypothetical protein WN55_03576 [Dufourea novaeangliae]|uniref:Uncharacterized protein n=1 Tax=Dufourea novaeangliae TaxID=178035 RepID=A0A154PIN2_DUFNO|nr:hypothetical protein WN55_03576 [Dufourea novaeangliae]
MEETETREPDGSSAFCRENRTKNRYRRKRSRVEEKTNGKRDLPAKYSGQQKFRKWNVDAGQRGSSDGREKK